MLCIVFTFGFTTTESRPKPHWESFRCAGTFFPHWLIYAFRPLFCGTTCQFVFRDRLSLLKLSFLIKLIVGAWSGDPESSLSNATKALLGLTMMHLFFGLEVYFSPLVLLIWPANNTLVSKYLIRDLYNPSSGHCSFITANSHQQHKEHYVSVIGFSGYHSSLFLLKWTVWSQPENKKGR